MIWFNFAAIQCVLFVFLAKPTVETVQKTFVKMTSISGSNVCAVDTPSFVFTAVVNSFCVPPSAQCAWSCTREPSCTSYNYKTVVQQCELYFYEPTNFTCIHIYSCRYFLVRFDWKQFRDSNPFDNFQQFEISLLQLLFISVLEIAN